MKNAENDSAGNERVRDFFSKLKKQNHGKKERRGNIKKFPAKLFKEELFLKKKYEFTIGKHPVVITKLSRPLLIEEVDKHRVVFCKGNRACENFSIEKRVSAFSCINCPQKNNPKFKE